MKDVLLKNISHKYLHNYICTRIFCVIYEHYFVSVHRKLWGAVAADRCGS